MIDRLMERIDALQSPIVVGLDPTPEMMPEFLRREMFARHGKTPKATAEMFTAFNREIIDRISGLAPAVKPQIAFYEKYGLAGLASYLETVEYAKKKGLIVIGDIKRGDIASTAAAYAGHIGGAAVEGEWFDLWQEDAVTVNPYFGIDGIAPFVEACNAQDRGIFVLVRTSNPSSGELQDLALASGGYFYERVAELVEKWGGSAMGRRGYSRVCAVVGATHKEQGEALRGLMPHTFFLVPGYGAQGGTGADLKGFFDKDGRGCIVNSSRGITAAYKKSDQYGETDFGAAAAEAVLAMKADLGF